MGYSLSPLRGFDRGSWNGEDTLVEQPAIAPASKLGDNTANCFSVLSGLP